MFDADHALDRLGIYRGRVDALQCTYSKASEF